MAKRTHLQVALSHQNSRDRELIQEYEKWTEAGWDMATILREALSVLFEMGTPPKPNDTSDQLRFVLNNINPNTPDNAEVLAEIREIKEMLKKRTVGTASIVIPQSEEATGYDEDFARTQKERFQRKFKK